MDLTTAERLASSADPKGIAALKHHKNDPAAARAVAGQFSALLLQNVMQGTDGAALSMAGDGVGGNIVSGMFASAISQAAATGGKLGLADMLFRSIEAKQHSASAGSAARSAAGGPTRPAADSPRAAGGHSPSRSRAAPRGLHSDPIGRPTGRGRLRSARRSRG